jgi:hypothetical protein
MSADIERTLDEILSGVNALLAEAPTGASKDGTTLPKPAAQAGSVRAPARDLDPAPWPSSILALLAMVESDANHPGAAIAGRLAAQFVQARALPLGAAFAGHADVRVSPLLLPRFQRLAEQGAVMLSCDAMFSTWDFSRLAADRIPSILSRMSALLCPDQGDHTDRWKIPHLPERVPLQWISSSEVSQEMRFEGAAESAVIDLDNPSSRVSTILWINGLEFVPDWWCGMAFRRSQWCPVIQSKR